MPQAPIRKIAIDGEMVRVWPSSARFPYVYREAMEVDWDPAGVFLYAPRPRPRGGHWPPARWFEQILKAARRQGWVLTIERGTSWVDVPVPLRREFLRVSKRLPERTDE